MSDSTPLKRCTKCGNEYPPTTEYFRQMRHRGKLILRSQCHICECAQKKQNRQTPQYKAYKKLYRQSDQHKTYMKAYQQTARYKDYLRSYRERPEVRENRRLLEELRRVRKVSLSDQFSQEDWNRALAHFEGCCAVCGRSIGLWHTLAMDHWIPVTDPTCPGTVPTNIIPLCHGINGCNNSKKDRDPVEWLTWKFGSRKAKRILARIQAYFDSLKDTT